MSNLDFTKSEQYTLSIRLSADGFSFSVHTSTTVMDNIYHANYSTNTSISLTANIKEMISSVEILKYTYKQINILVDTDRFTPVPFELFDDEHTEDFFYQNFQRNNHEIILCNILGKSNVALIFGMDKYAHQLLNEYFPKARIFTCVSPLAEYFMQQNRNSQHRKLFVHFRENNMEMFAFDKGKLLLINTFACQQTNDQIYYILYTWQQLGFNQEKDQLYLAGNLEMEEIILPELNKFLRQVKILPSRKSLPYDIQTLMICE